MIKFIFAWCVLGVPMGFGLSYAAVVATIKHTIFTKDNDTITVQQSQAVPGDLLLQIESTTARLTPDEAVVLADSLRSLADRKQVFLRKPEPPQITVTW